MKIILRHSQTNQKRDPKTDKTAKMITPLS